MYKLKHFIEWQAFGVCSAIGVKLGIALQESVSGLFTFLFLRSAHL